METEEIIETMENESGFFHHNQYHVETLEEDNVILRVDLSENSLNPYGIVHGAILFGLGDNVMGMLASKKGRKAVTLSSDIHFLKPGNGKYLIGKGEILKEGKNTAYLQAKIYNDQEELIATMSGDYFYID